MSESLDRVEASDPDELGEEASPDEAGLVNRVSAAGFQVTQAMEGLDQVAGLLRAAEELAKDADARRREAEDEVAFAEGQARELGELLALARSDTADVERRVADAEERATQAEDRLQQALERAFALEAELEEANGRTPAAPTPRQITVIVDDQRDELRDAVAAEVRRPLTSIMGLTLALKHADPTSTEGKHMVRQLGASARRLERLVVQLLELDGIANGSYTPNTRRADIKAIVRRVVEETPDVEGLDVRVHAEHAAVEVDPALAEQMVETLLANAARRSQPGSPVWVQVSSDHTGAVIAVDDASPDVPSGLVADPNEGPAARQKNARVATGLALVSRLAELHGGRAWVEERQGGGASFRVFLPSGSVAGGSAESSPEALQTDETSDAFEDRHDDVVVDATAIGSTRPEDEPEAEYRFTYEPEVESEREPEPDRSQVDVYAGLRELSSFDDLSDELAI